MTNELFNQLWEWSYLEGSFTIRDFAKSIEMTYKTIYDLSKENEDWSHILNLSKCRLACNSENAINTSIITNDCYTHYVSENDYTLRDNLPETEGIIIPEDPNEFDKWVKDLIKKEEEEERKFEQRRGR